MKFDVKFVSSADKDLDYYKANEQRFILKAIFNFLGVDANIETKKRKPLRPTLLLPGNYGSENIAYFMKSKGSV
jgi:hypothetical protein